MYNVEDSTSKYNKITPKENSHYNVANVCIINFFELLKIRSFYLRPPKWSLTKMKMQVRNY